MKMRTAKKSKTEIIDAFTKVFRKNGLGTTLSQLTAASGLQRASLYHFFPNGKQDMYTAVMLRVIENLKAQVLSALHTKKNPTQRLKNMLRAVNQFYAGGLELCFITVFSFGEGSEQVQKLLSSAVHHWTQEIESTLKEMKTSSPKKTAHLIMSSIQGALVLSYVTGESLFFKNTLKEINVLLQSSALNQKN